MRGTSSDRPHRIQICGELDECRGHIHQGLIQATYGATLASFGNTYTKGMRMMMRQKPDEDQKT